VNPAQDAVKLDGKRIAGRPAAVYYLVNKPRGVVCTMEDPQERPCVGDLLKKVRGRPVPAGRLDFDTEGLLLCTNDGDTVQRIIHPRHRVRKVYHVKVSGLPAELDMETLRRGVLLDGTRTLPAGVYVIKRGARNCWLRMTLLEGRNRQVRRMMEQVGLRVLKLRRVALGPFKLGGLKPGEYRTLNRQEVGVLLGYLQDLDKNGIPTYAKRIRRKTGSTRGRAVR
jgi:23S rRNA pseudouridine2605 synthase